MSTQPVFAHRTPTMLADLDSVLVTAVIGPAGGGKTSAVRHHLEAYATPHRWITVAEDSGAHDFLRILTETEPGLVVVDNSHHLPRTPEIRQAFDHALEHGRRFVFIGRSEPPANFWRMVGRGEGLMVGFEDLLLSAADVAEMATSRGLDLAQDVLAELHGATRGWPAPTEIVLDTVARSTQRGALEQPALTEASHYLQVEAVESLPDDLRGFCAHLAHLGTFSVDLVRDAVGAEGADLLARAWRSQAMILRADSSPAPSRPGVTPDSGDLVFPPIVERLLRRDRTGPSPAEAVVLHRRASRWHEARNEWDRALTHMLQASHADAVRQLGRLLAAMEPSGRSEEALQWFRQLPRKLRMQPASVIGLTLALVQAGYAVEARQLLDQTDPTTWTRPDEVAEIAMAEAMVDRVLVRHGPAVAAAERALRLLDDIPDGSLSPGRLSYLRVMTLEQLREIRLWNGELTEVRELMSRIHEDVVRSELQLSLVHSTAVSAVAALDAGELSLAVETANVALRLADRRQFQDTHIVAEAHFVLAAVAAEHDEIEVAAERLTRARELATESLFPTTLYRVELLLATTLARLGRAEEAWAVLETLGAASRRTEDPHLQTRVVAASALVHLYAGDSQAARAIYGRLYRAVTPPDVLRTRLQLATTLGSGTDLGGLIGHLPERREPIDQVLTLLIKSHNRVDIDPGGAVDDLTAALRLAEQLNLWRTVLTFATGLGPLMAGARAGADLARGPSPTYVRRIGAVVIESTREVSALSARETEIAHYLPTRKTNGQIAAELYISENTVKTHVRHIYQKLGVEHRDEAVTRLVELGLTIRDRRS